MRYQEEKPERIEHKKEETRQVEKAPEVSKAVETNAWKPEPDTIRVTKGIIFD